MKKNKADSIFDTFFSYYYYFIFMVFTATPPMLFTVILTRFKFFDIYCFYWKTILIFLGAYFIPTTIITFIFLRIWNKNKYFFAGKIYSRMHPNILFNKNQFKRVIELSTTIVTFILFISAPFSLGLFDNPWNTFMFMVYPINFGFKVWEYTLPKKSNKQYFPHRKYK
ncbi:hypothetical protein D920_01129 [Enterococcus faecalis 13-SD-W-01]|nr:hypothetical protein D920_01129 [Enterococcus faecalis 13-SD-W-01]